MPAGAAPFHIDLGIELAPVLASPVRASVVASSSKLVLGLGAAARSRAPGPASR